MERDDKIEEFMQIFLDKGGEIKKLIQEWIVKYLKEHNNYVDFDNSNDEIEPVWITVEVDRHSGMMANDEVEHLEITDDITDIYISTENGYCYASWLNAYDLYEIYGRIIEEENLKLYEPN